MAIGRKRREHEQDPFTDLLFNALLAFTFMFMVTLLMMSPPAKKGDIRAKAEYIITVTWEDLSPDDVDTWVQDPGGNLVWFRQRESGLMHLDRDDRGLTNDTILVNGREVVNPLNQEVVTIRGMAQGEYVVNLQYYETKTRQPVQATVSVVKVNPSADVVFYGNVTLPDKGSERTAVRFTIGPKGEVRDINTLQTSIVTPITK